MLGRSSPVNQQRAGGRRRAGNYYANPAAQQLLAQSSRKLFKCRYPNVELFSLNIDLMRESLAAGQGFTIIVSAIAAMIVARILLS